MPAIFPPISDRQSQRVKVGAIDRNLKIKADVIDLISALSDIPKSQVTLQTELATLGITSLDFVEFIVEMERKWNLHFTDAEMDRIKTVGDAIQYVQKYS